MASNLLSIVAVIGVALAVCLGYFAVIGAMANVGGNEQGSDIIGPIMLYGALIMAFVMGLIFNSFERHGAAILSIIAPILFIIVIILDR